MTLSLCLESYGAAVHVMDSLFGVSAEQTTRPLRHVRFNRSAQRSASGVSTTPRPTALSSVDAVFAYRVRVAASGMPFEQAQALWLVDVCNCTYDEAAAEASVSRDEIVARIVDGRRFIRANLAASRPVVQVG